MNQEVEIRVKINSLDGIEKKLLKHGEFVKTRRQTDKYFIPLNVDYFEEKNVFEYLRIRIEDGANHVNYSYCNLSHENRLISTDEYETVINDPDIMEEIFLRVGLRHKVTVIKERKHYDMGDFEVTLDHVENLGYFVEIEAKGNFKSVKEAKDGCYLLLDRLEIEYKKAPDMGYPDMVLAKD